MDAGQSSSDRGMVIDLRHMNQVTIDPRRRRATVGGGALLADLDRAAHRHGLATTGGMVHHAGVAGLTLGGGYGWLGRLHGLSCDNLVSAQVVTAAGDVVTASADEHAELLWGLRGGGGNFGVVTGFAFALHPVGPVLSRHIRFPAASARVALRRYRDVMDTAPRALCSLAGVESGRGTGVVDAAPGLESYVWYTYAGDDPDPGLRLGEPLPALRRRDDPRADAAALAAAVALVQLRRATARAAGLRVPDVWSRSVQDVVLRWRAFAARASTSVAVTASCRGSRHNEPDTRYSPKNGEPSV